MLQSISSVEPSPTALLLLVIGALLLASAVFTRPSARIGLPVALLFMIVGMLAGEEGLGGIIWDDYRLAFRLGTIALVLILFDGGLNTAMSALRQSWGPATVLATFGVAGTAGLIAWGAYSIGLPLPAALLLGAIVSSTDAAATFSVLRGGGLAVKRRVATTLEVESGLNDPLAVILTITLTENLLQPVDLGWPLLLNIVLQMAVGLAVGYGVGRGGAAMMRSVRLPAGGLYPVLTLALACMTFGAATLLKGSGFLAVYVAGLVLGQGHLPFRGSLRRVHDAIAWLSQIGMFLILGLLVVPSRLMEVAWAGLGLALFLIFFARPVVVALCLAPFRYPLGDVLFVGWAGLRGAVPIVLAIFPILAGAPGATRIFDLVFFIVVVSAVVQGGPTQWITRHLGLESTGPPPPPAVLEVESAEALQGEILSFYIDPLLGVEGTSVGDLPFPPGAAATMIVRGNQLIAPKGNTVLEAGDHLYVLTPQEDRPFIQLMFGRPEGMD
jgi:potassium/hydrogen antiporter